jgi:K+-sensing histidine kinase KdpD
VSREAARLDELVSDMLDLSLPRPLERQLFDLATLAREVVALSGRFGRAATDVEVVYVGCERAMVHADPSQLRQLIWNLVRNAVQASGSGDVVTVGVEKQGNTVLLSVEDEGEGIEPALPTGSSTPSSPRARTGTGVGLAVVKRIADDHGFSVEVRSGTGRGAVFGVRAPARGRRWRNRRRRRPTVRNDRGRLFTPDRAAPLPTGALQPGPRRRDHADFSGVGRYLRQGVKLWHPSCVQRFAGPHSGEGRL